MINTLIFQKLITTMAAVLDAAALSNNWILVDRTSNRSAKSTASLKNTMASGRRSSVSSLAERGG